MAELKSSMIKLFSRLGSCGVYGMAMNDLAEEDANLAVATADLCFYSGLDRFKKTHPEMFYNVGIAEQNLIGMAGGLAKEGMTTFVSTYASFACTRAMDQVNVNMGYMQLPINVIGLTSGFSVGVLGPTHMCINDLAIMRSIPNLVVLSPADGVESYRAIMAAAKCDKPVYIRLSGAMSLPMVYTEDFDYQIGKANVLKEDGDITIFATGTVVYQSQKAIEILEEKGIHCNLVDIHTIKPLDEACVNKFADKSKLIFTVEEHSIVGGLGSAIADVLAEKSERPALVKIGVTDEYSHAASFDYLMDKYGLTPEKIASKIEASL